MSVDYIFDLGSSTAKLYRLCGEAGLHRIASESWCLLESGDGQTMATETLARLSEFCSGPARAIGTEIFRRSHQLAAHVTEICSQLGIDFRVIDQSEEADLIRRACRRSGIPTKYSIVNVGGGSMQIVHPRHGGVSLLPFGVADLAQRFDLNKEPEFRRVVEATQFVFANLPKSIGPFAYTGGERSYLQAFGAAFESNGTCTASEFGRVAEQLAGLPNEVLGALSPFDAGWMRGAIASNCVVEALLSHGGHAAFLPTDLNISHGLLTEAAIR